MAGPPNIFKYLSAREYIQNVLEKSVSTIDQEIIRASQLVGGEEINEALESGEVTRDLRKFLEFF